MKEAEERKDKERGRERGKEKSNSVHPQLLFPHFYMSAERLPAIAPHLRHLVTSWLLQLQSENGSNSTTGVPLIAIDACLHDAIRAILDDILLILDRAAFAANVAAGSASSEVGPASSGIVLDEVVACAPSSSGASAAVFQGGSVSPMASSVSSASSIDRLTTNSALGSPSLQPGRKAPPSLGASPPDGPAPGPTGTGMVPGMRLPQPFRPISPPPAARAHMDLVRTRLFQLRSKISNRDQFDAKVGSVIGEPDWVMDVSHSTSLSSPSAASSTSGVSRIGGVAPRGAPSPICLVASGSEQQAQPPVPAKQASFPSTPKHQSSVQSAAAAVAMPPSTPPAPPPPASPNSTSSTDRRVSPSTVTPAILGRRTPPPAAPTTGGASPATPLGASPASTAAYRTPSYHLESKEDMTRRRGSSVFSTPPATPAGISSSSPLLHFLQPSSSNGGASSQLRDPMDSSGVSSYSTAARPSRSTGTSPVLAPGSFMMPPSTTSVLQQFNGLAAASPGPADRGASGSSSLNTSCASNNNSSTGGNGGSAAHPHCPYDLIFVLDFEATCEEPTPANYLHEIIEFPIVVVDVVQCRVVLEFHSYVKPVVNPVLSPFCTRLTGISQQDVDQAPLLQDVIRRFETWYRQNIPPNARVCFATDGPWDMKEFMYLHSVKRRSIHFPQIFYTFIDVKAAFSTFFRCSRGKIKAMLDYLGLPLEGRLHSGIDDSRNVANIVIGLLLRGCTFVDAVEKIPFIGAPVSIDAEGA